MQKKELCSVRLSLIALFEELAGKARRVLGLRQRGRVFPRLGGPHCRICIRGYTCMANTCIGDLREHERGHGVV